MYFGNETRLREKKHLGFISPSLDLRLRFQCRLSQILACRTYATHNWKSKEDKKYLLKDNLIFKMPPVPDVIKQDKCLSINDGLKTKLKGGDTSFFWGGGLW